MFCDLINFFWWTRLATKPPNLLLYMNRDYSQVVKHVVGFMLGLIFAISEECEFEGKINKAQRSRTLPRSRHRSCLIVYHPMLVRTVAEILFAHGLGFFPAWTNRPMSNSVFGWS
jgi:hypothetical protein